MNYCPRCGDPISNGAFTHYCPTEAEILAMARLLRTGEIIPQRDGKPMKAIRPKGARFCETDEEEKAIRWAEALAED